MSKHIGSQILGCPACLARACREGRGAAVATVQANAAEYRRRHDAAVRRSLREATLRSMGLVKVRGGWE